MNRRAFMLGLLATTTLVAAPVAVLSEEDRRARIMALLESKMEQAKRDMMIRASEAFYSDTSVDDRNFGLASLVDDATLEEIHNAPEYDWSEVSMGFTA